MNFSIYLIFHEIEKNYGKEITSIFSSLASSALQSLRTSIFVPQTCKERQILYLPILIGSAFSTE
jgi:hypothetical protein